MFAFEKWPHSRHSLLNLLPAFTSFACFTLCSLFAIRRKIQIQINRQGKLFLQHVVTAEGHMEHTYIGVQDQEGPRPGQLANASGSVRVRPK